MSVYAWDHQISPVQNLSDLCITPPFPRGHEFAHTKPRLTFGDWPGKGEQEALFEANLKSFQ